jgi:hypothetical protein
MFRCYSVQSGINNVKSKRVGTKRMAFASFCRGKTNTSAKDSGMASAEVLPGVTALYGS